MKFTEIEYMNHIEKRNYIFEYLKLNVGNIDINEDKTLLVKDMSKQLSNEFDISIEEGRFYIIEYLLNLEKEELERVTWMW